MARVNCEVEPTTIEADGFERDGVRVTCTRCEHAAEVVGVTELSVRRCVAILRESCPRKESNWYVPDRADAEGMARRARSVEVDAEVPEDED